MRVSYKDGRNISKKPSTLIALLMRKGSDAFSPSTTDKCKNTTEEGSCLAINFIKNGKAAGSDNIPVEILKFIPSKAADTPLPLFQEIWQREMFPNECKEFFFFYFFLLLLLWQSSSTH
jgi:hypothetical protein